MADSDARLASDLSLAVMRLARQLRFRNPSSPVSLSQLSALATLVNYGPMTPGALAIRERVRPPSMTRVIASLADLGFGPCCAPRRWPAGFGFGLRCRCRTAGGRIPGQPGVACAAAGYSGRRRTGYLARSRRPDLGSC